MKKPQRKPKTETGATFVKYRRSMLKSEAFRALSRTALMILHCLELKHLETGGKENGRLKVSYADFAAFGIRRPSIRKGIRQVSELGFAEATKKGWRSGDHMHKSEYRLTYVDDAYGTIPTDEWRKVVIAKMVVPARRKRKANGAA
jgi:hypothetical protein